MLAGGQKQEQKKGILAPARAGEITPCSEWPATRLLSEGATGAFEPIMETPVIGSGGQPLLVRTSRCTPGGRDMRRAQRCSSRCRYAALLVANRNVCGALDGVDRAMRISSTPADARAAVMQRVSHSRIGS